MAGDLNFAVELEIVPTVRERDGLAMSSRNRYLDETQRAAAPSLYAALSAVRAALENGAAKAEALAAGRAALSPLAKLDYLDVVDGASFLPIERLRPPAFVIGAARFGTTRLDRQRVDAPVTPFEQARIFLGVAGGIAAYKAAALTSALVQRGASVDVVMTAEAERFVGAVDLRVADRTSGVYLALGSSRTHTAHSPGARGGGRARRSGDGEPDCEARRRHRGRHPDRGAARGAHSPHSSAGNERGDVRRRGNASQSFRAARRAATKSSIRSAVFSPSASRVWGVWPPRSGCSKRSNARCGGGRSLQGKRVAITAGPTREAFDPVRFVSNASTGSTGIELAREAALRGARVTLLLGPTLLEPPAGVEVVRVTSARELYDAALAHATGADLVIASAAVADWRPAESSDSKLKKGSAELVVAFEANPDVLAALGEVKGGSFLVGFAAETDDHEANARAKLRAKHLDAIAVNDVRGERGFGLGQNELVLLWGETGRKELGRAEKATLAARLLDGIEELMQCS